MSGFWNGLRTLEEALAGLDDPHGERFSRIEERLRELEGRRDRIAEPSGVSSERPKFPTPHETVAAAREAHLPTTRVRLIQDDDATSAVAIDLRERSGAP